MKKKMIMKINIIYNCMYRQCPTNFCTIAEILVPPEGSFNNRKRLIVEEATRSTSERLGWRSLRSAFASIRRIRSRVTSNCLPTSSSVVGVHIDTETHTQNFSLHGRSGQPERRVAARRLGGRRVQRQLEGAGIPMKSPRCESSSSPTAFPWR